MAVRREPDAAGRGTVANHPDTTKSGLYAVAQVMSGELLVMAQPVIPYREIVGKTPKKLWAMLDERVDRIVSTI